MNVLKKENYPKQLLTIDKVPDMLYYSGDINLVYHPIICIVGTRKPSHYGRAQTKRIVKVLAEEGYVILSGFANGIDQCAHQAAIDVGAKTIAILGAGIDVNYPAGAKDLRKQMENKHLFLSEYPDKTPPKPWHFPKRNRLLSAFSESLIVIECTIKSGTMITAKYAIEQGKDLWVLPGNITSAMSAGPNYLIFQGANPIYDIELLRRRING